MDNIRKVSVRVPTAEAMRSLGERIGRELLPGDFFGLTGGLGAGKTVLVQGICQGCGIDSHEVLSPTFTIVASHRGRLTVHHADFYRLGDADELYATGFDDLVNGESAVLVEWVDQVPEALPPEHVRVHIEGCGEAERRVELSFLGSRFQGRFAWLTPEADAPADASEAGKK